LREWKINLINKTMTDKEIGKIAFDKFGLQECDEEYTYFILGYKEAQAKQLRIGGVSQQRELLIEAFDLINVHDGDREKITKLVDITLKSINCG